MFEAVQDFILQYQACIINNGQRTHFHTQTVTESVIDLSIVSPELVSELTWELADCSRGSDHFPIKITSNAENTVFWQPKYILEKADWKLFRTLTYIDEDGEGTTVDEMVNNITNRIQEAAGVSIPQSKGGLLYWPVPWWTEECTLANNERKSTETVPEDEANSR